MHIIAAAFELRAHLRAEFDRVLDAEIDHAEAVSRGNTVNARGRAAGVTTRDLWTHNTAFAQAYASDELLELWITRPRTTFGDYQAAAGYAVRTLEV